MHSHAIAGLRNWTPERLAAGAWHPATLRAHHRLGKHGLQVTVALKPGNDAHVLQGQPWQASRVSHSGNADAMVAAHLAGADELSAIRRHLVIREKAMDA